MCEGNREIHHTSVMQEQERSQRGDGGGAEGARSQMPVSSVGEDRAILLGFTMMAFSVLMFFVVGITTVKPYIDRYPGIHIRAVSRAEKLHIFFKHAPPVWAFLCSSAGVKIKPNNTLLYPLSFMLCLLYDEIRCCQTVESNFKLNSKALIAGILSV